MHSRQRRKTIRQRGEEEGTGKAQVVVVRLPGCLRGGDKLY